MYLVKDMEGSLNSTDHKSGKSRTGSNGSDGKSKRSGSMGKTEGKVDMVLKVTSILSRQQRDIAEKEAKLLSRVSLHEEAVKYQYSK